MQRLAVPDIITTGVQELSRLQKLVQLPPIPEALKSKFSKFDADLNPTHDQDGNELDSKVSNAHLTSGHDLGCCSHITSRSHMAYLQLVA